MRRIFLPFLATAFFLGLGPAARANFVVNGDFETGNLTGWTLAGPTLHVGVIGTYDGYAPHSGNFQFVMGNSGSHGTLSQSFATAIGQSYHLSYWLANTGNTTPTEFFSAAINGTMISGSILNNPNAFGWTQYNFDFTATGASTTLQFEYQNDPHFFHLDDVDVESNTPAVPVPGGLALAACGIVTMAGYQRRRRRRA